MLRVCLLSDILLQVLCDKVAAKAKPSQEKLKNSLEVEDQN